MIYLKKKKNTFKEDLQELATNLSVKVIEFSDVEIVSGLNS